MFTMLALIYFYKCYFSDCKLTCHKKCYVKVSVDCGKEALGGGAADGLITAHKIFGTPLHQLVTGDIKVPIVVDRLITTIEMYGLYTEGIYRKSGVSFCTVLFELKFENLITFILM